MTFLDSLKLLRDNWRKQDGQTMAEYGVILAVITLAIVAAVTVLSGGIAKAIDNVVSTLGFK